MNVKNLAALLRHSDDDFHNVTYEYADPDRRLAIKASKELYGV